MSDEEVKTGPGRLILPPGSTPIIGANPLKAWESLEPLPNEYLASLKMNILHAFGQGAQPQHPISIEIGVLAGLMKEVEGIRASLPALLMPTAGAEAGE